MLYRILRSVNSVYAYCVLALYIGAFFVGFAMLFVFPQITLLLLFLGLGGLGVFTLMSMVLRALERKLAHRALVSGSCPLCLQSAESLQAPEAHFRCMSCGAVYTAGGEEMPNPALMGVNPDDRANS